jgi:hypothetical protein
LQGRHAPYVANNAADQQSLNPDSFLVNPVADPSTDDKKLKNCTDEKFNLKKCYLFSWLSASLRPASTEKSQNLKHELLNFLILRVI